MTRPAEVLSCSCNFEAQHEQQMHPAMRALEKEVLGCDFGGSSWTTRSQADLIPAALGLNAASHLLDIGAGTGWPGLYLAGQTGTRLTMLDIPVKTLQHANRRAMDEKLADRCYSVAASGSALPFTDGSFDNISHSDVLCCLPDKLNMLKECRRVARNQAKMLFYVIAPAHGLAGAALDRACAVGPPFVAVPDDYDQLLSTSGWAVLEKQELSRDYLLALSTLAQGLETRAASLSEVLGEQEFKDQLEHRHRQISAISDGLLERKMYLVQAA